MTWSSQQYLQDGIARGFTSSILRNAIDQIEDVVLKDRRLPAILTLKHLAIRTGIDYRKLRSIAANSEMYYEHFRIRKRSGGHRLISVPDPDLMTAQRWIATYILRLQVPHHCSFAFTPETSIVDCASRHTGARWLVKMDVAGFFGSISEIQVYRVFRALGYQRLIAFELTRLTTIAPSLSARYRLKQWRAHVRGIAYYQHRKIGYLPQGAPTSPMLSNLVMRKVDEEIEAVAKAAGVRYTRYSDDITFSTPYEFDRHRATQLIRNVSAILRRIGLTPNDKKTTIVPPGGRKVVLGLLVDGAVPRLTRNFRDSLDQHLYYLRKYGPVEHAKSRAFDTIGGMYRHIRGLIDYATMVEPVFGNEALRKFNAIPWML